MIDFANHLRRRYSRQTVPKYLSVVKDYVDRFGTGLDVKTTQAWRNQLVGQPATKNRKVAAIKAYASYRRLKVSIPYFRSHRKPRVVPSMAAVDRVPGEKGLMLRMVLCTGMRIGEALSVRLSDIDQGYIRITGKGSKTRVIPIPEHIIAELRTLGRDHLFPYSYSWARGAAQLAGIKSHDMRHDFATTLNEAGVNLVAIRDLLGHNSTATTTIYTHPTMATLQANHAKMRVAGVHVP